MKFSKSAIRVLRDFPSDAEVISHKWMIRAGYIVQHASGIYSFAPLFFRVYRKIFRIIEEEMDRAGAAQIQLPLLQPAEPWKQSGRWRLYEEANLMFQLEDRKGALFGLCPTAEEIVTDMADHLVTSIKQVPFIVYQQHTKFRDELRPRYGLVRCREFTMMDAYSFDVDDAGLGEAYKTMDKAYRRAFDRCGLDYVVVEADSGAIGGSASEEFMAKSEIGEDTLLIAEGYAANSEQAVSELDELAPEEPRPFEVVDTPGANTIAKLCESLGVEPSRTLKTMIYEATFEDRVEPVAVLIRGDKEVNEVKLLNHLNCLKLVLAAPETVKQAAGTEAGYVGPTTLAEGLRVVADESVRSLQNFVAGCGEKGKHAVGVNHGRDFPAPQFVDIRQAMAGEIGPTGKPLESYKGIEVGHIFKLGDKYSKAANVGVTDSDGKFRHFQMGCYGIGTSRIAAAIIEQSHDDKGIIWPLAIAPYPLYLVPMKYQDEAVRKIVDEVCDALDTRGIDYLLDDRQASGGVKFGDADAIGIPYRITFGRDLAEGYVELKDRRSGDTQKLALDGLVEHLAGLIDA